MEEMQTEAGTLTVGRWPDVTGRRPNRAIGDLVDALVDDIDSVFPYRADGSRDEVDRNFDAVRDAFAIVEGVILYCSGKLYEGAPVAEMRRWLVSAVEAFAQVTELSVDHDQVVTRELRRAVQDHVDARRPLWRSRSGAADGAPVAAPPAVASGKKGGGK